MAEISYIHQQTSIPTIEYNWPFYSSSTILNNEWRNQR